VNDDKIAWYENLIPFQDCNGNGVADTADITNGTELDCNSNGTPDSCELAGIASFDSAAQTNAGPLGAPWAVEDADVDLDGDLDLVVAGRSGGSVYWFTNDGTGQFGGETLITNQAPGVFSVTLFDADGDGDEDVVTAESAVDTISLYLNLGGSFGPGLPLDTALDGARTVRHADIDGDGDEDVIAGSLNDDTVAWYPNLGGGAFGARQTITSSADHVLCVDAADVDGDGDFDVISASRDDNAVRVFENLGLGAGWVEHLVASVNQPSFVRASDLNGDGQLDIAFTSVADGSLAFVANQGSLTFGPTEIVSTDLPRASSLTVSDLDLDGDVDLAASGYGEGSTPAGEVAWFENLGAATFGPKVTVDTGLNRASFVCAARLDADGYPDLAAAVWTGDQVLTYRNQLFIPTAEDCNANGIPDECDIASGTVTDCNGDGVPDPCQLAGDPTFDLNANGIFDSCESIGFTYCSPAVSNSTGEAGVLTVIGNEVIFLNNVALTARALPANSFGFFVTSQTSGFTPNVPNSQGALCLAGNVGR
ncbi:MAG: VCBS repeat-containing protein, partial [Planctomycetota bacterium]|nr:VCBS repeat-containing protein [Planctomycetota bacterium]